MVVASLLDPASVGFQASDPQTSNPLEMVRHVGHVVQGVGLLKGPPFLLTLEQVLEEPPLHLRPLPHWRVGVVIVEVGPDVVIQVLPPASAPMLI